ncbi:hypothetical protein Tco_0267530 [Tanacetum coccineum]
MKTSNDLRVLRIIFVILPEHQSDTKVIHNDDGNPSRANIKQALGRFNTTAGNPVKEILLKLNLPDHMSILTDSKEYIKMDMERRSIKLISYEVLKLKNIKEDGYTRFQYQEQYGYQEMDKNKDKVGQNRARDRKERENTSPTLSTRHTIEEPINSSSKYGGRGFNTIPGPEFRRSNKDSVEILVPIPVKLDEGYFRRYSSSDSFLEESDTSLSYLDNSLPEFESFSDHTEETRSGSTTTHANYSLLEYDSFLFDIEPDQGGLISIVIIDNLNDPLLELPEFESFHLDPSFPHPPLEPPDVEICYILSPMFP